MPADAVPPRPSPGPITSQFGGGAPPYLGGLNEEQSDAVLSVDGPLLVLAGAGTGKTRVLTTRIAHILATRRARGSEILAVTFTNKAAREMKDRVGALVGGAVEGMPWLGTFHSIGARILRRNAEMVGLKPDFTILDTDDQIRLIKQLIAAENIDEKRWPARQFAGMMDGWKNRGLLPKDVKASEAGWFANGRGENLYADYQVRLKTLNAADFGDLLLEGIRLFRENPGVLAEYHRRFKFMLVDEYQDSNVAQYQWLRLLASGTEPSEANLCVVGDDDQSIYGWRGAEVDNILRFEKDFPGAKVIRLERNYRSTANILAAASHLIAHNESRLGKTLQTDVGEDGDKLSVTSVWDSEEEARQLGEEIEGYQREGRMPSTTWRSWCAPRPRCAPSKTASTRSASAIASSAARVSTSAARSATPSPICASSTSPPTISPSSASSTSPSAASVTPPSSCCGPWPGPNARRCSRQRG